MYANNIVLFSKATRKDATTINECIIKYCKWSGQNLNRSKSGIFFSKQTPQQSARAIKQILQMKKLKSICKHDRCTFTNSVTQTTPIYTMSSFKVPNSICNKLDALSRKFWWKPKEPTGKYLALKSWDKLCTPEDKGGLGFKKARDINSALLAKLAWMIASKQDSLCMSILRAKYKVKEGWLHEKNLKHSSPIWRAIEEVKSIIAKGACYLIGDRVSINVWQDPWVPWIDGFRPKPKTQDDPRNPLMVSHLMDQETRVWKANLIQNIFDAESSKAILSIPISLRPKPDKLIWVHNPKDHSCSTSGDIIKLLTNPPQAQCPPDEHWITTLNMAFVLDEIWRARNQVVHHGEVIDIQASIKLIHHKLAEYSLVWSSTVPPPASIVASLHKWNPPPFGWIKLNTNAAIGEQSNAIAVVARNHIGEVLKVWARSSPTCCPLRAEASAILWAIQLAKVEKWPHIVIEGDAKNCFDPLSSSPTTPDWTISNTISSIQCLREFFLSCIFNWVKRV
ncbi:hypothetical protein SO802_008583 [Lithocarpus litseifolius]|uniref:RNase H type-1 domain-containing protein n=1 Tax=Lithocarpus litseifolius TaxID=425828 RepID=A0AAW2DD75_9ROSI